MVLVVDLDRDLLEIDLDDAFSDEDGLSDVDELASRAERALLASVLMLAEASWTGPNEPTEDAAGDDGSAEPLGVDGGDCGSRRLSRSASRSARFNMDRPFEVGGRPRLRRERRSRGPGPVSAPLPLFAGDVRDPRAAARKRLAPLLTELTMDAGVPAFASLAEAGNSWPILPCSCRSGAVPLELPLKSSLPIGVEGAPPGWPSP